MYDKSDPRAALASTRPAKADVTGYSPPDYVRFYESEPGNSDPLARTWLARGQNAIVAYSEVKDGACLERHGQPDEWAIILPERHTGATLEVDGIRHEIPGYSVTFVPPGDSRLTFVAAGPAIRLFTTVSSDLAERCLNAAAYAEPHHNIPPFRAWPAPPDGLKVRTYSLDVPDEPGRFGRIWRCTTFMVNYLAPHSGPRNIRKLSPHHHDDFEQYSLALMGSFVHHMRWPWTPDMTMWRDDESEFCGTPSVAVIPPPAIHTSRGVDPGTNQLVDIFAPPRMDFSTKEGWVLNAADYPKPSVV